MITLCEKYIVFDCNERFYVHKTVNQSINSLAALDTWRWADMTNWQYRSIIQELKRLFCPVHVLLHLVFMPCWRINLFITSFGLSS